MLSRLIIARARQGTPLLRQSKGMMGVAGYANKQMQIRDPFFDDFSRMRQRLMRAFDNALSPLPSSFLSSDLAPLSLAETAMAPLSLGGISPLSLQTWIPRLDLIEHDNSVEVQAELPGVKKEDVQINIKDGVLTISGESKYEKTWSSDQQLLEQDKTTVDQGEKKEGEQAGEKKESGEKKMKKEQQREPVFWQTERRYGKFTRSIELPKNVDFQKAEAKYENGILHVFLPKIKAEEDKSSINIQVQ